MYQKKNWIERHNKWHHYNVREEGEDEHLIEGSQIKNFINTMIVLTKTYRLLEISWRNFLIILFRMFFFWQISFYALPVVYSTIIICTMYLTFITHCAPVINKNDTAELKQIHRSVDIFPQYSIVILLTGAFNMHTAHHLSPNTTRDGLLEIHNEYIEKYPVDYRVIRKPKHLLNFFLFRHVEFSCPAEWNKKILN